MSVGPNKDGAQKPEGLLMVMMEPDATGDQEFQDWYDTEHIPERTAIPGFLSAQRYVCTNGWPRYVALYDLRDVDVLKEANYQAIAGANFSPWTKRILGRVRGLYRMEGSVMFHQGPAKAYPWLMLLRFRDVMPQKKMGLIEGARRVFTSMPEHSQRVRLYKSPNDGPSDYLLIVETLRPTANIQSCLEILGADCPQHDILNHYTRYWRHESRYPMPS